MAKPKTPKLPFQLGSQSQGARFRPWYKRLCNKLMRKEAKRIEDPDTDTAPRRRFMGWD
jgi:hypothetical protein